MNYKYQKKPVVVEAFQMTQKRRMDNSEWPNWLHEAWNKDTRELGSLQPVCVAMAEYVDMFRETHPKGRKRYVCCECRGIIALGEIHQKIDALFEGKFYTHRTCTDCENDRNRIQKGLSIDDLTGWGYLSESEDFEDRGDIRDNLRWRKYRRNESVWPDTNNFLHEEELTKHQKNEQSTNTST